MEILLFIIVLALLVLVHEFGHFISAKKLGMRVDEFGIGFPPRLFAFKKGETEYSLNLIPLGGFVKIFGEDPDDESIHGKDSKRSMVNKPKWAQALVVSAGVFFNLLLAWFLVSLTFFIGAPMSVGQFGDGRVMDRNVVVLDVAKGSPAEMAGLQAGDKLLFMSHNGDSIQDFSVEEMQSFIANHGGQELQVLYKKGEGVTSTVSVTPVDGIIQDKPAIGVTTDDIGIVKLGFFESIWEGLKMTIGLFGSIAVGLFNFIVSMFSGTGSLSQITGPVGIVGLVGSAAQLGFIYLLNFVAFISVNLAVLNSIPFPALDGGRLLFILVEFVIRRNIKPVILNSLNLVGFALLIGLMVVVTYNDILRMF